MVGGFSAVQPTGNIQASLSAWRSSLERNISNTLPENLPTSHPHLPSSFQNTTDQTSQLPTISQAPTTTRLQRVPGSFPAPGEGSASPPGGASHASLENIF